jgi:predicted RecB family nuclease
MRLWWRCHNRIYNPYVITDTIFEAFLNCETKSRLKLSGESEHSNELIEWHLQTRVAYRQKCQSRLRSIFSQQAYIPQLSCQEDLTDANHRLVLDCTIETRRYLSRVDAIERVSRRSTGRYGGHIPVRFVPNEKLSRHDKLLLAFDALTLGDALGKVPPFGKIIHGAQQRIARVKLSTLLGPVQSVIEKIRAQAETNQHPQPILNKHCPECEFNSRCRQIALEKDDLSLLSRMSTVELENLNKRGIFSVRQLSYTFRARRRPQQSVFTPHSQFHALKALAIRERKIHILGQPQVNARGNHIFLDVEGVPDQDFYYLIGLRIGYGESSVQYSFWANDVHEEREIWAALVTHLTPWVGSTLIHYGSYESTFLDKMIRRYPEVAAGCPSIHRFVSEAINVLRVVSTQVFFPTYSNGLKEVAHYLGFRWTNSSASGLYSLMWRSQWDRTRNPELKERIITYNAEDCAALQIVLDSLLRLSQQQKGDVTADTESVIRAESIRQSESQRFGRIEFSLPELDYINRAAYWGYQRSKVYVRSSPRLRQLARLDSKESERKLRPNKILACRPSRPTACPKCHAAKIYKYGKLSKTVHDLRFGLAGIKRWIVKYYFPRFLCWRCKRVFSSHGAAWAKGKYGSSFIAYVLYNVVDLQLSQAAVARLMTRFFGFDLGRGAINNVKARAAVYYQDTYDQILAGIVRGNLVQADETKISINGRTAFVWVFTNLEAVAYVYSDGRTNATPKNVLSDFHGVLVSDFYAGYDAIDCRQQKCLIHLIRDLNDDLHKHPFNEELKALVSDFAALLRPMIQTVDRFGLKARFLGKHLRSVKRFYRIVAKYTFRSEVALKSKKRFERNRERLFTFLEFDGVPWNNNNAEHAIKALADLRSVIGGTSSVKGIQAYLVLLSICQTCKYKGIDFLEFVRSRERDVNLFARESIRQVIRADTQIRTVDDTSVHRLCTFPSSERGSQE